MNASDGTAPDRARTLWLALALAALLAALLAVACGDDDGDDAAGDAEPAATATEAATEAPAAGGSTVDRLRANASAFEYEAGTRGGTLTLATIVGPLTFNLALATDAGAGNVLGNVFEGLTEQSWLTDETEPALAESWESSEDGLVWTFRLRRGVQWHDGAPFTAQDVAFTFNDLIYNDDLTVPARAQFTFRFPDETGAWQTAPMAVDVIDDHTVRFTLPVPFAPFLRALGTAIYPKHLLEEPVRAGTFAEMWGLDADPSAIVGTGPFTLDEHQPGERIVLARNPNYWMKDAEGESLPYLDAIVYEIVGDLEAMLAAFRAGESDVVGIPGKDFAEFDPLQQEGNFTIHRRGPTFGTTFLSFNLRPGVSPETGEPYVAPEKRAWFERKEFRQAVSHAIDRDAIIEEVFHGLGYAQWASISPSAGVFHNPDVRQYPYSVDEANRILDGLGWTDGDGDGIREDADGNPIRFTVVSNEETSVRTQIVALLQESLRAIGVEMDADLKPFGDLVRQLDTTYDWEAVVVGLTGGSDPHDGIGTWHSSGVFHVWHSKQESPATEWEAEIDRLYVEGSQELDREKRVALYHEAQAIAAEQTPLVYTALPERLTAIRNVFGNTTPTLYGVFDVRYLYRLDE